MQIKKELLDLLACPICKNNLVLNNNQSSLDCIKCLKRFPIKENIPLLLADMAIDYKLENSSNKI